MAKLKEALLKKILADRPRTQKLIKEFGNVKAGDVTIAQVIRLAELIFERTAVGDVLGDGFQHIRRLIGAADGASADANGDRAAIFAGQVDAVRRHGPARILGPGFLNPGREAAHHPAVHVRQQPILLEHREERPGGQQLLLLNIPSFVPEWGQR